MIAKRCTVSPVQYIKRFSKCLHVNHDRNLVVVNHALEKDLSEADMASYTKIFSSCLCKQRQVLICSFPLAGAFLADTLTKRLQLIYMQETLYSMTYKCM